MGIKSCMFSDANLEALANELAMLYLKKSNETFSDPKDLARRYVETQELIAAELYTIRKEQ